MLRFGIQKFKNWEWKNKILRNKIDLLLKKSIHSLKYKIKIITNLHSDIKNKNRSRKYRMMKLSYLNRFCTEKVFSINKYFLFFKLFYSTKLIMKEAQIIKQLKIQGPPEISPAKPFNFIAMFTRLSY